MALYFFMDNIIFLAYRISHLSLEQLPPLPEYDYAEYLVNRTHHVSLRKTSPFRNYVLNYGKTSDFGSVQVFQAPPSILESHARIS